jgi:hypothetical protein
MERRRPNRELKNSEDVQDALIEDYFRRIDNMKANKSRLINNDYYHAHISGVLIRYSL